jgi:hypothetical protein
LPTSRWCPILDCNETLGFESQESGAEGELKMPSENMIFKTILGARGIAQRSRALV